MINNEFNTEAARLVQATADAQQVEQNNQTLLENAQTIKGIHTLGHNK